MTEECLLSRALGHKVSHMHDTASTDEPLMVRREAESLAASTVLSG